MPWTVGDVDRFKKGLSPDEKKRWVAIANGALKSCLEKGGDELDCEVKAIKQANGSFSGVVPDLSAFSNPIRPKNHDEKIHLALADVNDGTSNDPDYQLAFPIGAFKTGKYGEVIITRTYAERMEQHWRDNVLGKRSVYMDTNHDFGEAAAWAEDMKVTEAGLAIKWDFNSRGRELISDRRYRFYSAAIGFAFDIDTGDEKYPVLYAVSLTNDPVMNMMPEAHLSTKGSTSAHGDGGTTDTGGEPAMTIAEILKAFFGLSDEQKSEITKEQRQQLADAVGIKIAKEPVAEGVELTEAKQTIETQKEQLRLVLAEKDAMSTELKTLREEKHAAHKSEVIEKALTDGRILPKNKEAWEKLFDKSPETTASILAAKGKEADFEEHGHGGGGGEGEHSAEELALFRKMGFSVEDIAAYDKEHQEAN